MIHNPLIARARHLQRFFIFHPASNSTVSSRSNFSPCTRLRWDCWCDPRSCPCLLGRPCPGDSKGQQNQIHVVSKNLNILWHVTVTITTTTTLTTTRATRATRTTPTTVAKRQCPTGLNDKHDIWRFDMYMYMKTYMYICVLYLKQYYQSKYKERRHER